MDIPGRVQGGVVVLDGNIVLPEGAAVIVSLPSALAPKPIGQQKRIQLPLVRTSRPGAVNLTGQRVAEIFDEEDVSPRH